MRIAFLGGTSYDAGALEDFLLALHQKYPDATIVTGNGRGAEAKVKVQMEAWGHDVIVPTLDNAYSFSDPLACQVNDILLNADIIVTVGSRSAGRAKLAWDIHARQTYKKNPQGGILKTRGQPVPFLDPENIRPFHNVAAPETKPKTATRRATKKPETLAA